MATHEQRGLGEVELSDGSRRAEIDVGRASLDKVGTSLVDDHPGVAILLMREEQGSIDFALAVRPDDVQSQGVAKQQMALGQIGRQHRIKVRLGERKIRGDEHRRAVQCELENVEGRSLPSAAASPRRPSDEHPP